MDVVYLMGWMGIAAGACVLAFGAYALFGKLAWWCVWKWEDAYAMRSDQRPHRARLCLWEDSYAVRSQAEAGELVGAGMAGAERTRDEMQAEIDRLREALAWYAEAENYYSPPGGGNPVREDMGNRARNTLAPDQEQGA